MLSLSSEKQKTTAHLAFCGSNGPERFNPFPGAMINIFNAGNLQLIALRKAALLYFHLGEKIH